MGYLTVAKDSQGGRGFHIFTKTGWTRFLKLYQLDLIAWSAFVYKGGCLLLSSEGELVKKKVLIGKVLCAFTHQRRSLSF